MSDDSQQINDSNLYNNDKDEFFNKLEFSFRFCFKYNSFYDSIKILKKQKEEKVYIINKKYIYEIKSICHFDEINNTLKKHEEIMEAFNKADYNYFIKLKKFLPKNTLIEFFSTKKADIKKRLDTPNIFKNSPKHLNNDQSNNLFYYNNCQIIDKDLFDALEELDIHLREKTFEANAIYSSDNIILFFKEKEKYIINVGEINNNTNEFEIVFLIQSEESTCSCFDLKKFLF